MYISQQCIYIKECKSVYMLSLERKEKKGGAGKRERKKEEKNIMSFPCVTCVYVPLLHACLCK